MKKKVTAILTLAIATALQALTLNQSNPIVIPDNVNEQEQYAAEELGGYLGKVLGGKIQIVKENEFAGGKAIFLGDTKAASGKGSFAIEEFRISVDNEKAVIAGNRFRGILYGAYEFLERYADVRFFAPTCERVPRKASLEIPDGTDFSHKPAFEFRHAYPGGGFRGWSYEFRPKFRCNESTMLSKTGGSNNQGTGGGCHTYYKYSMSFPQEISWMNAGGERVIVKDPYAGSICFSQPEVLRRFTVRLKELIAGDREKAKKDGLPPPTLYAVQQNDCDATCFCPECLAFKKKHGLSGLVLDFSNKLADAIKDEYPDVYIVIFAYFDTLEPPISDIRPRPNVLPQITTYTKSWHDHLRGLDDPANAEALKIMDRWAEISPNLAMWDYWRYYGGFYPPSTIVKHLPGLMKKYRDMNVRMYFTEYEVSSTAIFSFYELTTYVGYRLMDDPAKDLDTMIREFTDSYYGNAGATMRKYLDFITEKFLECGNVCEEHLPFYKRKYVNDLDFYKQGLAMLADAEKAIAGDKTFLARIHIEKMLLLSTYVKVIGKGGNDPLKLNLDAVRQEIEALCPEVASVLLNEGERTPAKMKGMINYFAEKRNYLPTYSLNAVPLDSIPAEGAVEHGVNDITSAGVLIDDPTAPEGKSYSLAAKNKGVKHNPGLILGMYERQNAYYVSQGEIRASNIPKDEKYHWYFLGKTYLYPDFNIYLHWTWLHNAVLGRYYDENNPSQLYDVYILLKLQGPAYVKGSQSDNDVRLAKVALVKRE